MKKYIKPEVIIIETQPQHLLCASLGNESVPNVSLSDAETVDYETADTKQQLNYVIWDDYEDSSADF